MSGCTACMKTFDTIISKDASGRYPGACDSSCGWLAGRNKSCVLPLGGREDSL